MIMKQRYQKAMLDRIVKNEAAGTVYDVTKSTSKGIRRWSRSTRSSRSVHPRLLPLPLGKSRKETGLRMKACDCWIFPLLLFPLFGAWTSWDNAHPKGGKDPTVTRYFSEIARDHLQLAIIDGNTTISSAELGRDRCGNVSNRNELDNLEGPHPALYSSEIFRVYKVIISIISLFI